MQRSRVVEDERAQGGGASRIGAMYQFTEDRGAGPAVALLGRRRTLYGPGRTSYEAETVLLVGKTITRGELPLGARLGL